MKKLFVFVLCMTALTACNQKGQQSNADLLVTQERDSLNRIIAQKDNEINDMMGTLNDIEEGFRAINAAEDRVSVDELRRTLDNLTKELEEKDTQIKALMAELEAKNIQITELSTQVTTLETNVANLSEESTQKSKTISAQDKQLNTAWFVFGTKKELKEQRIIEDGEVLRSNFNQDYFTKIDIRVDKEIKLYSRSAKLLTSHPASSYRLEQDANKQYVLRIENPSQFWSTSKYLVIQVK